MGFVVRLIVLLGLCFPTFSSAINTFKLAAGWNLVGNSSAVPIDVATSFGDPKKITSVWKWNRREGKWAFYTPSMNASQLLTHTQINGYDILSSIDSKEGFWVNAVAPVVVAGPVANGTNLSDTDIPIGWNLVSSADNQTPSKLNASLASNLNASGKAITTIWAWEKTSSQWRFFAPAMESQGGTVLSDFVGEKGYLQFSSVLSVNDGYWVNVGNIAPVANAGTAQSVVVGTMVTLDASTSSVRAGGTLTYAWTLTDKPVGSAAVLAALNTAKPTFVADVAGSYVASVIVNDGTTSSSAAAVTVTASVANAAPVANAGVAQSVMAGSVVTLDGRASSDANSDPLTYVWTFASKPSGSAATLISATTAKPSFVPDVAGSYVLSLTVNDGKVNSAAVTVAVTAAIANAAPVAKAGAALRFVVGSVVTLDGTASTDANGDALNYSWSLTSKPTDSNALLSSLTLVKPTFVGDMIGTYVVTLVVNDGKLSSAPATNTITVVPRINGALGISTNSTFDFCGISGQFTTGSPDGNGTWTINNCAVYGTAGSPLFARIQNNGSTSLTLTKIKILSGIFFREWSISPTSQTISSGSTVDFALPMWLGMEVTNAVATFSLSGESDFVVQLKGSMTLP